MMTEKIESECVHAWQKFPEGGAFGFTVNVKI